MNMQNVAVIGGGYWGKNIIKTLYQLKVLKYICDKDEETCKNYHGMYPDILITSNPMDIANNREIERVFVAVPSHLHYGIVKLMLLEDKDVFVEKPITLNLKEAEELVEIARGKNRILMVGHLLHYHPCVIKMKAMIKDGMIGRVRNVVSNRLNLGIFRMNENVLWSFAPHDISVILSLCENRMPDTVVCYGKDHITKGVYDITNSILRYEDGRYININVNWLNPYKEQRMSIIGEKGMIVFDDTSPDRKLVYYPEYLKFNGSIPAMPIPIKNEGGVIVVDMKESPLEIECRHFLECCETQQTPITDGQEAVRVLKVLMALEESLRGGQVVKIGGGYYVDKTATVDEGAEIGEGTKIWHYTHISRGAKIGKNCNIGQNVYIADGVSIGDECKIQNNVSIYKGVEVGRGVFFGPSCVLTNDINPRAMYSKGGQYMKTIIEDGVTLGANCTIVCGNRLGRYCLVGAGAVVTKDVEEYSVVVGNPAREIGKIDERGEIKKRVNSKVVK